MKKSLWLLAALCLSSVAQAAGNDELWAVTTKMEMEGMPFAMPGQTSNVCIEKGKQNDPNRAVPADKDQNCKMSDVKVSGNKSSWKMKCTGKEPMTGSGEMTSGNGSYTGKMQMHSADGDMNMRYDGKRIGTCDYATENPSAKANAMIAEHQALSEQERIKECRKAVDDNSYGHFLKPDCSWAKDPQSKKLCAAMACPDMRPQMCERLSKKLSASDDDYLYVADHKEARKLALECGLPFEKATRAYCKRQVDAKDYQKVAEYCDKEAKPLFDKHCAGRDYTAAMDSGYGPICQRYGKWKEATDAPSDAQDKQSVDSKPNNTNPAKAILDGAKNLKGMFGF
ncbi:MAG: DUF3617 family protein [Gallionella sp.]